MKIRYLLMLLVIILCLFECNGVQAQRCLSFSYDENGNREQKIVFDCLPEKDILENQDNIEDIQEVTDVSEKDIIVFPNPTTGNFKVAIKDFNQQEQVYMNIYDMYGNIVLSSLLTGNYNEVNIANRSSGAYLLKIVRGDDIRTLIILKQ